MSNRKGIILAGGLGTRLYPLTLATSKQLLPIYDKPMIYYPLTVLMLAGIKDILLITTPEDAPQFKRCLGNGKQWGINLSYQLQNSPDGLAQAYILAEDFLAGAPSALILGDNLFFGHGLPELLTLACKRTLGASIFGYHVANPKDYGVIAFDENGGVAEIVEKPLLPPSNFAVTGLYMLDGTAPERAKTITPSARGELEITSLLNTYVEDRTLGVEQMGRGYAWFDAGTHVSLLEASNFVRTLTERQGLQVGSPDEIAYRLHWITKDQLSKRAELFTKTSYGQYLDQLKL
jgi:glucose-1-phosphate thymidylyltransferase